SGGNGKRAGGLEGGSGITRLDRGAMAATVSAAAPARSPCSSANWDSDWLRNSARREGRWMGRSPSQASSTSAPATPAHAATFFQSIRSGCIARLCGIVANTGRIATASLLCCMGADTGKPRPGGQDHAEHRRSGAVLGGDGARGGGAGGDRLGAGARAAVAGRGRRQQPAGERWRIQRGGAAPRLCRLAGTGGGGD